MSHAPTAMPPMLQPLLRGAVTVVGVLALLLTAASVSQTPNAFAAFHADHGVAVADCPVDGGGGGHLLESNCSIHSGCIFAGLLPTGPTVVVAHDQDWAVVEPLIEPDWVNFPAKPPPNSRA